MTTKDIVPNQILRRLTAITWAVRLTGILGFTILVSVFSFVHLMQYRQISDLQLRYTADKKLIVDGPQIQQKYTNVLNQIKKVKETQFTLSSRLPETPKEIEYLGDLSILAKKYSIKIRDFRPEGRQEFANHREVRVRIHGQGSHASLYRFIDGLNRMNRVCRVTSLSITPTDSEGHTCSFDISISLAYAARHNLSA